MDLKLRNTPTLPFMSYLRPAVWASGICLAVSLLLLGFKGLELGLDFTGGTLVDISIPAGDVEEIRARLESSVLSKPEVTTTGEDIFAVQVQDTDADQVHGIILETLGQETDILGGRSVGPRIGDELRDDGGLALIVAAAMILLYVALRFQFSMALGAVAAVVHDVVIVLGVLSVLQLNFDLSTLAALLAVLGYSLNDTIVIADRIREVARRNPDRDFRACIDDALNATLGRTIATSFTTLLVLISILLLGGATLQSFAVALGVGVVIGSYSSLYVFSAVLIAKGVKSTDLLPPDPDTFQGSP